MEEISGSSHNGQAEPAAEPVPSQLTMSAGKIVKVLPSLSPGLSQALLHYLQKSCTAEGVVILHVRDREVEKLLEQECEGFAAELEAVAAVEEGSSSDVILQLTLCLLLALAPSLPNARQIHIDGGNRGQHRTYGGEQAVEVLYSALVSQHWSNAVRRLQIWDDNVFGTDRGCEHLAHLLQSGHCKLQQLTMVATGTGAGGMRHIARALRANSSLTVLEIWYCGEVGDGGVEQLAAMLRTNSTLEELTLNNIGMTAHGLGHLCDALSTQLSLPATSSYPSGTMPNGHMGGLKKLDICGNEIGQGGAAHLGAMLAKNRCLQTLLAWKCSLVEEDGEGHLAKGLRENSTLEVLEINKNDLGKVALGLLVRCLATNNNTSLKRLNLDDAGEMPAAEELAHMITHNQSLVELDLGHASYDAREWATVIFPALGRNKTLLSIDLENCPGVQGQQVRAALFDLLRINTTIQEIHLEGTPLDKSGEAEAVEAELRRNKVFTHALSGLPTAIPKSCRIVLCGHPYAGKSSLLQTMKLLQQDAQPMSSSESEHPLSSDNNSTNQNGNAYERTRGIDIHLFKDDPNLRISVWDLAGHREFHALHDFMFPSGNNAATLFVLTFSPIVSPMDELRAGEIKTMQELEHELLYWLRFITSNSKPNAAAPTVVVVITHKDRLRELGTCVDSWLLDAQENIIPGLVDKFSGWVKVQPLAFMVNALASQDVELNKWIKEVEELLRSTLDGLEKEPAICTQVLRAIQQDASQTSSKSPILSRTNFVDICKSFTADITAEIAQAKEKEAIEEKIGTAVGAYLHDAGEVIHHDKLDLIISNPKWFCHGILGQLIDLFPSYQRPVRPKNGLVSRTYLSSLLQKAVKSVPGLDPTVVTPDQLIRLMLLLDLCYEQKTPGDPHTYYLVPAIFDDEGNKAADGKRPLTWRPELNAPTFVGRRLQCADLERTFLTDGFFPRLQVVLHNHAFEEKWVENKHSGIYKLEKNLFSIWVNGMEILIEFSGSSGYFVDILVKSSKSHQQTMEFLHHNIIRTIRTFCASQEGCQGVTLAEAIIRPECLHGADGGNPILCTYRTHQSILVEVLREKMKRTPDYEHCWEEVEDGAVLKYGLDSGTVLLDGPKDIASRPEPNLDQVEEVCYPNTWKQGKRKGKRRGLALIVSMEKEREGGQVDRAKLEVLAHACGFMKVVLLDPVARDLTRTINSLVEDDLEDGDECFLCSINGHGGTQDGKPFILDENGTMIMVIRDIIEPFLRSEHLQGKPKIFWINCCRGMQVRHGDAQQVTGSLPPTFDCLLVFSTLEGFSSSRNLVKGTTFVSQLVDTVMEKKETEDVLSMMTMVSSRVNGAIIGQCCELRSFLVKKLYWKGT